MTEESFSVPNSWVRVNIEEILDLLDNGNTLQQGWSPRCESVPSLDENSWGVLKTTAIQIGSFLAEHNKKLPESLQARPQIEVKQGDILMTCAGPRYRCGVTCLVKQSRQRLMMSGKMYRFRTNPKRVLPRYLELFLHTQEAWVAIDKMKTGISDSGLNLTHDRFRTLTVPLSPFKEQHRIVAKIEELFSKIDKGVESLETAKAQLQVYRQALLKHAFDGKLTAQWRAENPDKVVPAEQLLEQVKQAREGRYQQQLDDWKAAVKQWKLGGKEGKKPSKPRLPQLKLANNSDFMEGKHIPSEWAWTTFESLLEYVTSGSRGWAEYYASSGSVFVRAQNLKYDRIDLEDVAFVDLPGDVEGTRSRLETSDILITITGANVTKSGIVESRLKDAYISQHVALCRLIKSTWSEYVYFYILAEAGGRKQLNDCAYGAGKPGLNLENIKSVTIPFCSYAEQLVVLSELKKQFSVIASIESQIEQDLKRAEGLRQSILKKAFSGQLVPQDPNDEPASQLLARIKAEKAERQAQAKATETKKPRTPHKAKAATP